MRVNNVYVATKIRVKSSRNVISLSSQSLACGPVSTRVTYYNYLPVPVVVVERNGFRHSVQPTIPDNSTQTGFIIRTERVIRSSSIEELRREALKIESPNNDELTLIREALIQNRYGNIHNGFSIDLDTVYTLDDFKDNNKCLYCDKRDVVISLKSIENASSHPGDIDSIDGDELGTGDIEKVSFNDFALRLEIIDNYDIVGSRFTFALGEVRKIKTKKDPNRQSGVYYHKLTKDHLQDRGYRITTEMLSITEADEKFGLFKSYNDAKDAGDLKEVRKKENLELQHQIEILKKNSDIDKAYADKTKRERDEEIARIEHANNLREKDWEYSKREYEHKNRILEQELEAKKSISESSKDGRKDALDLIKFLPQLIIAIGAIFVVIAKVKPIK